jgi:ABC-2 type transport system ATP-binding protein
VFLSSHVLAEVERVCDRVAIVRAGHLVALEDVGELIRRRKRRVEIELDGPVPDLSTVPGLSGLVVDGHRVTCALEGDPRPLLAALDGAPVVDLTIEPATLEDAFLELYAGEEADEAAEADEPDEPEEADQATEATEPTERAGGGPTAATGVGR